MSVGVSWCMGLQHMGVARATGATDDGVLGARGVLARMQSWAWCCAQVGLVLLELAYRLGLYKLG